METLLIKTASGYYPANEDEAVKFERFKLGAILRCKISEMRNPKRFRRWWILAKLAFDYWTEMYQMPEHKGVRIEPNFDKFRQDLTINSGFFHWVVRLNGDAVKEADSLAWSSMTEDSFDKLYSASINVVLKEVYKMQMSEDELRNAVEEIMSFD